MKNDLARCRKIIDVVDEKILDLLTIRAKCAIEIGKIKHSVKATYVPSRETEIINNLIKKNEGVITKQSIISIYREIISACRGLEAKLKVAYLAPQSTSCYRAGLKLFGSNVELIPIKTISDVICEVEKQKADFAIVPVENSNEGSVNITLDKLADTNLKIINEIVLNDSHKNGRDSWMRFFVLGNVNTSITGKDKTSIIFTVKDKVSALHNILSQFSKNNINLTKIESRPTKKNVGQYIFFVDFDGHIEDKKVSKTIKNIETKCTFLKVLGSYPKAN